MPVPATVPAPDACANATTVELSAVTVLPAASLIVAVRTLVAPDARSAVEPVRTMSALAPWTTLNGPSVPDESPAEVASIVTAPARTPVIVLVATPAEAVALPVPLTVPAPLCCANATTVVLSETTVLPAASWIVAVSTRVVPEVRSAVEPVRAMSAAVPWTTLNEPSVPVVSPAAVASIVTEPARTPVIVLVATPLEAVALPVPVTVPVPEAWRRRRRSSVGGDGVAGGVLDRGGQDPGRAGGEVGGGAGERDLGRGAVDDGEAPRVPVVRPAAVASIVTGPARAPVIVLVATPRGAVALPVP